MNAWVWLLLAVAGLGLLWLGLRLLIARVTRD
jgi:hypothetical protein